MKLFISGEADKFNDEFAYNKINEFINHNKPILYLAFTNYEDNHSFEECFKFIKNNLKMIDVPFIDVVKSVDELRDKDFSKYSALFIDGDDPFKLLKDLNESKCFEKLKDFLIQDGVVFAKNAGATIFGTSINTSEITCNTEGNLDDFKGLNVLNNFSLCHFTNEFKYDSHQIKEFLENLSKKQEILVLPKESLLFIDNGKYEIFGNMPFYISDYGNVIAYNSKENNINEFYNLKTDSELMNYMNSNITYGWLDDSSKVHFNNLTNFRINYRVSSINEILESKVGTCIEQVKLEKYFFDRIGLESKLYCHRSHESEDNVNQEVKMHCFLLFKYKDIWFHFEHSNSTKRGIHPFTSLTEALNEIRGGFEKTEIGILTEITDIPDGLSFSEFIEYINKVGEEIIKLSAVEKSI